jgi:hypothetical protein
MTHATHTGVDRGTSGEICYCMVPQCDSMCDRADAQAPPYVRVVRPAAGRFSTADHVSTCGSLVALAMERRMNQKEA